MIRAGVLGLNLMNMKVFASGDAIVKLAMSVYAIAAWGSTRIGTHAEQQQHQQ